MDFKDPKEREIVLGPLFATEAKAAMPVFGPHRFTSKPTKQMVNDTIKKALQSTSESVVNLLRPTEGGIGVTTNGLIGKALGDQLQHVNISRTGNVDSVNAVSASMSSSRELHGIPDFSFMSEQLDNVMLRRAKEGYLFDCKKNKKIVGADHWLQEVWGWIDSRCY